MSAVTFRMDGLEELITELRDLPKNLVAEAEHIVEGESNYAAVELKAAYGSRAVSGHLRDGVIVQKDEVGEFGVKVRVRGTAPHNFIYENGTQARHNRFGANRGSMPPANVFVPIMVRRRRVMYEQLFELLVRNGLTLSGTP